MKRVTCILFFYLLIGNFYAQVINQSHLNGSVSSQIVLSEEAYQSVNRPGEKKYVAKITFHLLKQKEPDTYTNYHRSFLYSTPVPSEIRFVLTKASGTYQSFTKYLVAPYGEVATYVLYDTLPIKQVKISAGDVRVSYVDKELISKSFIESYYSAGNRLKSLENKLDYLRFKDPDEIERAKEDLDNYFREIQQIQANDYPGKLNLTEKDPIGLLSIFPKVLDIHNQKKAEADQAIANWHILYYQKATSSRYRYSNELKREYLNKALLKAKALGKTYADPYYQLGLIDFEEIKYQESLNHLDQALSSDPSSEIRQQSIYVYQNVFNVFIANGDKEYGEKAIEWYYQAKKICDKEFLQANCNEIDRKVKLKRTAVFNQYLAKGTFDGLGSAQSYLNRYAQEINNPEKLDIAFQSLYSKYLKNASTELWNRNFQRSFDFLQSIKINEKKYGVEFQKQSDVDKLFKDLFSHSLDDADKQRKGKNFSRAQSLLGVSERIMEVHFSLDYDKFKFEQVHRDVHTDVFHDKIQQIKTLIKQNKFEEAGKAINIAELYGSAHRQWIGATTQSSISNERKALYEGEFSYKFAYSRNLAQVQKYLLAQDELIALIAYRDKHANWLERDKEQIIIDELNRMAPKVIETVEKTLYRQKEYLEAIGRYYLIKKYSNAFNDDLAPRITFCIESHIQEQLTEAESLIATANSSQINEQIANKVSVIARNIEDFALGNQYNYSLPLAKRMKRVKSFLQAEECKKADKSYNEHIAEAKKNIEAKQFLEAMDYVNLAEGLVQKMPDCQIDAQHANELKSQYSSPAEYQGKFREVLDDIESVSYKRAINTYIELGSFYQSANIKKFGLSHQSLLQFLSSREEKYFQEYGLNYFYEKKEMTSFNELFQVLLSRDLGESFFGEMGARMARMDKKSGKMKNANKGLKRFPKLSNEAYKAFRKGYRKAF